MYVYTEGWGKDSYELYKRHYTVQQKKYLPHDINKIEQPGGHGSITDCYIHHNVVLKLFRKIQNKCKTSALSDYLWRAIFQISFSSTILLLFQHHFFSNDELTNFTMVLIKYAKKKFFTHKVFLQKTWLISSAWLSDKGSIKAGAYLP